MTPAVVHLMQAAIFVSGLHDLPTFDMVRESSAGVYKKGDENGSFAIKSSILTDLSNDCVTSVSPRRTAAKDCCNSKVSAVLINSVS